MRVSVDNNIVETDEKIYEFANAAQAENFINCLLSEGEIYCALTTRPVRVIRKPSLLPFALWGKLLRSIQHISERLAVDAPGKVVRPSRDTGLRTR